MFSLWFFSLCPLCLCGSFLFPRTIMDKITVAEARRVESIGRQVTLHGGPFGLFLVRDTPEVRAAAAGAGAIVDEPSAQTTNSWGLRGPEPDPKAQARGSRPTQRHRTSPTNSIRPRPTATTAGTAVTSR